MFVPPAKDELGGAHRIIHHARNHPFASSVLDSQSLSVHEYHRALIAPIAQLFTDLRASFIQSPVEYKMDILSDGNYGPARAVNVD